MTRWHLDRPGDLPPGRPIAPSRVRTAVCNCTRPVWPTRASNGPATTSRWARATLSRLLILLPGQILMPATEGGLTGGAGHPGRRLPFLHRDLRRRPVLEPGAVNHTVRIESMDPNATTPVQADLENGHATVPVSFGSVGNWTLTVNDLTDPSVAPMTTVPISVLSNSPMFVIEPVASPVTAGEAGAGDHPQPGARRTKLLDAYNGFAMLAAETGPQTIEPANIQFTGGIWTGEVTFFGAAQHIDLLLYRFRLAAQHRNQRPLPGHPGAFAGLQVLLPGQDNQGGRDPGSHRQPRRTGSGHSLHGDRPGGGLLVESRGGRRSASRPSI